MTRSKTLRVAVASAASAAILMVAAPAGAVSIKHTNRAGGDPDQTTIPVGHAAAPADTTGPRMFDKAHEVGNR